MGLRVLGALVLAAAIGPLAPAIALADGGGLEKPMAAARADAKLAAVERDVAAAKAAGVRPVVVFDIDDTLVRSGEGRPHPQRAVPGAAAYVRSLQQQGAKIVYLTGRPSSSRAETKRTLDRFGMPLPKTTLITNGTKLPTVEYKERALGRIEHIGKPVAFFDNEKENARMFRASYPDHAVKVFRPDTRSTRPDPGGKGPIFVIKDFRRR